MGRKCLLCGELFGCLRGGMKYSCDDCRLVHECGIRNHFTTARFKEEICPDCVCRGARAERPPATAREAVPGIAILYTR